jgi:hypothetical protein
VTVRTVIELTGTPIVTAEPDREIGLDNAPTVRVYLGESLTLVLSQHIADQLGDALADVSAAVW